MFDFTALNWVAVVAAAVANIVVGFVWFLPQLFGNRWAAETGRPLQQPSQVPPMTWIGGIVTALIVAYVLALFVGAADAATYVDGAIVGFLVWLGFYATTTYGSVLFEGRSTTWWLIQNGYGLISAVVMGAILAGWPL